jgi:hypothetical protein
MATYNKEALQVALKELKVQRMHYDQVKVERKGTAYEEHAKGLLQEAIRKVDALVPKLEDMGYPEFIK